MQQTEANYKAGQITRNARARQSPRASARCSTPAGARRPGGFDRARQCRRQWRQRRRRLADDRGDAAAAARHLQRGDGHVQRAERVDGLLDPAAGVRYGGAAAAIGGEEAASASDLAAAGALAGVRRAACSRPMGRRIFRPLRPDGALDAGCALGIAPAPGFWFSTGKRLEKLRQRALNAPDEEVRAEAIDRAHALLLKLERRGLVDRAERNSALPRLGAGLHARPSARALSTWGPEGSHSVGAFSWLNDDSNGTDCQRPHCSV